MGNYWNYEEIMGSDKQKSLNNAHDLGRLSFVMNGLFRHLWPMDKAMDLSMSCNFVVHKL